MYTYVSFSEDLHRLFKRTCSNVGLRDTMQTKRLTVNCYESRIASHDTYIICKRCAPGMLNLSVPASARWVPAQCP